MSDKCKAAMLEAGAPYPCAADCPCALEIENEALRAENARYREALRNSRVAETMLIAGHLRDKAKKAEEMPAGFTIECVQPSDVAVILRCAADAIDLRARAALETKGTRDE